MKKSELQWLASLSKLQFGADELIKMEKDMEYVINMMDTIKDFQIPENPEDREGYSLNVLRGDVVEESYSPQALTSQAKISQDECFAVFNSLNV